MSPNCWCAAGAAAARNGSAGRIRRIQGDGARPGGTARPAADLARQCQCARLARRAAAVRSVSNPLDLTAQGLSQPSIYTEVLGALLDDDRVGAVVAGIIQSDPATADIKVPAILAALDGRTLTKPMIFAGLDEGARMPEHYIARCANGVCRGFRPPSAC